MSLFALIVTLGLVVSACATPVVTQSLSSVPVPEDDPNLLPTAVPIPTPVPVPADPGDDEFEATPVPSPTPSSGVSEEFIRIVTINDIETGEIADGIFLSAQQGIDAWVRSINSDPRRQLAGRQIELVPLDSGVINHAGRIAQVCDPANEVFALVGSLALQDSDGVDQLQSPDCRIPDFPALALTAGRRDSEITFLSNPLLNTFYEVAAMRYVADQIRLADPDAELLASDVQIDLATYRSWNLRMNEAAGKVGFQPGVSLLPISGESVMSQAQTLLDAGVQTLIWTADADRLAELLLAMETIIIDAATGAETDEGAAEGDDEPEADPDPFDSLADGEAPAEPAEPAFPDYVICNIGCYDQSFVDQIEDLEVSVVVSLPHYLVTESDIESEVREYLFWLREVDRDAVPSSYGLHAWASGGLFAEAVNRAVLAGSAEEDFSLLSREAVIDAARSIEEWDARGLFYGSTRPDSGFPSDCAAVIELSDGVWSRVRPLRGGGSNCDPENLVALEASVEFGLEDPSAPVLSATNSEAVETTDEAGDEAEIEPTPDVAPVDPLEETEELPD